MPAAGHVIPAVQYIQSGEPRHLAPSHQAARSPMLRYVLHIDPSRMVNNSETTGNRKSQASSAPARYTDQFAKWHPNHLTRQGSDE
jgi:hypothetical protein